jgi:hypothetical protein
VVTVMPVVVTVMMPGKHVRPPSAGTSYLRNVSRSSPVQHIRHKMRTVMNQPRKPPLPVRMNVAATRLYAGDCHNHPKMTTLRAH